MAKPKKFDLVADGVQVGTVVEALLNRINERLKLEGNNLTLDDYWKITHTLKSISEIVY